MNNQSATLAELEKSGRELLERLEQGGVEFIKLDGFDAAILGSSQNDVLVYSRDTIVRILFERDGMTSDEAHEYISFNIDSAFREDQVIILDR